MDGSKAATPTTAASVERDAGSSSILKLTLCAEAFTDPKDKYSINQHWLTDITQKFFLLSGKGNLEHRDVIKKKKKKKKSTRVFDGPV